MTKDIQTLVEDIYNVLDQGVDIDHPAFDEAGQEIADILRQRLNKDRQSGPALRLSSIGRCVRYQYYSHHEQEGEELRPQTRLKFLYGDIIESLLLCLVKLSGHEVRGQQDELVLAGIPGHRDAVIDNYPVDTKSASKYGFQKFVTGDIFNGDDPFGYVAQLSAYTQAADDCAQDKAYFLVMEKENGKLALTEMTSSEMVDAELLATEVQAVCEQDNPPDRPYEAQPDGKSGNMKLPVACSYCSQKFKCWEDANGGRGLRTFIYANGPRYLTTVAKRPDVEEVL